jgi:hypothetical protein
MKIESRYREICGMVEKWTYAEIHRKI